MKCAVIGGGGFIGSTLCRRLVESGYEVRLIERSTAARAAIRHRNNSVERRIADALDAESIRHATAGVDLVVHLASTTDPIRSFADPAWDAESNMKMARNVLDALLANNVSRLVYLSSGGTVYGVADYLPIDEQHPTHPCVPYGATKLAVENQILAFQRKFGIEPVILRVANAYGVMLDKNRKQGALSVFLRRALAGLPIQIWGDGSNIRDFLHVDDVADAIILSLRYRGKGGVFNIGSGIGISLNDLVRLIERLLGLTISKRYGPTQVFGVPANVLDSALAFQELDWRSNIPLDEGIIRVSATLQERLLADGVKDVRFRS